MSSQCTGDALQQRLKQCFDYGQQAISSNIVRAFRTLCVKVAHHVKSIADANKSAGIQKLSELITERFPKSTKPNEILEAIDSCNEVLIMRASMKICLEVHTLITWVDVALGNLQNKHPNLSQCWPAPDQITPHARHALGNKVLERGGRMLADLTAAQAC